MHWVAAVGQAIGVYQLSGRHSRVGTKAYPPYSTGTTDMWMRQTCFAESLQVRFDRVSLLKEISRESSKGRRRRIVGRRGIDVIDLRPRFYFVMTDGNSSGILLAGFHGRFIWANFFGESC